MLQPAHLSADTTLALWKSDSAGYPANHSSGKRKVEPASPGLMQEVAGPLKLCSGNALHATMHPEKWQGERLWIVALHGEVQYAEHKMGALKREIICEVKQP
jgi:hypothetical protein